MRPSSRRATLLAGVSLAVLLPLACSTAGPAGTPITQSTRATTPGGPAVEGPIVVAVGDIACDPNDPSFTGGAGTRYKCHQRATSALALSLDPAAVLLLGDSQYPWAEGPDYAASYDPTWGRLKTVTRPAIGNHEYGRNGTSGATGYFAYFGAAAGERGRGWYSFDIGGWHLIALNSMCAHVGGCQAASPQEAWLRADLAANRDAACTLAYWHHPRFSSGPHGADTDTEPLWRALFEAGAEIILGGHDHDYERFAPQTPAGSRDDTGGLRQFVVGTGGESIYPVTRIAPNSEAHRSGAYGVLALTLGDSSYAWRFIGDGNESLDSGSATCH